MQDRPHSQENPKTERYTILYWLSWFQDYLKHCTHPHGMKAPHSPPAHDIEDIDNSLGEEKVRRKEEAELAQGEGDIVADTLCDISADVSNCPHINVLSLLAVFIKWRDLAFKVLTVTVRQRDPSVQSLTCDCSYECWVSTQASPPIIAPGCVDAPEPARNCSRLVTFPLLTMSL